MPGEVDKILTQYGPDIEQLLGNIDDIRVTNKYSDAINEINSIDADRQRIEKFYALNNKIKGADLSNIPNYTEEEADVFNYDDPRIYQSDNELNKKYADYVTNWKAANQKEDGYLTFDKFIEAVPGLRDQLMAEGYYKKDKKKIPLTDPNQKKAKMYEALGFTPEDVQLYEQGLQENLNQDRYNEKLQNLAYKYYPQLISKGGRQDQLQKLLGDRLSKKVLNITPGKNGEYKFEIENGYLIKYNTTTGENTITTLEKEEEQTTKNWEIFEDDNGNPYWGERVNKNGKWVIEPRAELNKAEKRSYEQDMQIQQNKVDKSSKTTNKRRSSRGPGKFSMNKMDVNTVKSIKPSDIGTKYKTVEQLEELQKNSDYLTKETRQAIDDYLNQGPEPDWAEDSDNSTYDYFVEYSQAMDDAWAAGDKEGFSNLQGNFLNDLERYKTYLSREDYKYFADRYKKY